MYLMFVVVVALESSITSAAKRACSLTGRREEEVLRKGAQFQRSNGDHTIRAR